MLYIYINIYIYYQKFLMILYRYMSLSIAKNNISKSSLSNRAMLGKNAESKYACNSFISSKTSRGAKKKRPISPNRWKVGRLDPFRQVRLEKLVWLPEVSAQIVGKTIFWRRKYFWNMLSQWNSGIIPWNIIVRFVCFYCLWYVCIVPICYL